MDIFEQIEIFAKPKKSWFSPGDNSEAKLNALVHIANKGNPSHIYHLCDFLTNRNKAVRNATCKTIIHLFKKFDSKRGQYKALKYCRISVKDIDCFKRNFPTVQYVELLAISSLNGNGFVREKAVKMLAQVAHPRAILFIIYRLADWVLPVREAALTAIKNYKSVKYIDHFVENLSMFEWLQKVERTDLSGVYKDIVYFVVVINRGHVIKKFRTYSDKQRLRLAKHLSNTYSKTYEELKLLVSDKHFLIRCLVIDHFNQLQKEEIVKLLHDTSAKVRLEMLYCLKDQHDFESVVKTFLADDSATIRNFARYALKQLDLDFAAFYFQNLKDEIQIIGSIHGLAEVGARQYSETVKHHLSSPKIRIRKTAFLAMCKLDEDGAHAFALANLNSNFSGLRNLIIDYLSTSPNQEVMTKARNIFETGDFELKKSMLKLFSRIGGWTAIADLMMGTIDEDAELRQLAMAYVVGWKTKAIRLFSTPKTDELEHAKSMLDQAYKVHEERKYFKINPLDGLDFFFK